MALDRIRVAWGGAPVVGPGVSTFYMDPAASSGPGDLVTFFTAIASAFPTPLTWTIPGLGDTIDETTGAITGTWSHTGGAIVAATTTQDFLLGAGARMKWTTAGIHAGRHVQGQTYLVPMVYSMFGSDGLMNGTGHSVLITAAGNLMLVHPNVFYIWSRPKTGVLGAKTPILGAILPYVPTALRSRRS